MTDDLTRRLRVLVFDGAATWAGSLAEGIARHTSGGCQAEVSVESSPAASDLAAALAARSEALAAVDVVALSIECGLVGGGMGSDELRRAFVESMTAAISVLKESSVTVLMINGSTVVGRDAGAVGVDIARLDLACLQLSVATGISIIDVDRLTAELGADAHVTGPLRYSASADGAIADEVVRVLDDYGFFDARDLLAQVGSTR